jgi:hypothetical protein
MTPHAADAGLCGRGLHTPGGHDRTPGKRALAGGKAANPMDQIVPRPHHKTERARHAVAAHSELSHLVRNVPHAAGARGEESHVAWAEPADRALFVGDKDLAEMMCSTSSTL